MGGVLLELSKPSLKFFQASFDSAEQVAEFLAPIGDARAKALVPVVGFHPGRRLAFGLDPKRRYLSAPGNLQLQRLARRHGRDHPDQVGDPLHGGIVCLQDYVADL